MPTCNDYDFPTHYTLAFPTSLVGDRVHSYNTSVKRATEINVRQNLWASYVILDGRYPALVYQHDFEIYMEKTTPRLYTKALFDIVRTMVTSDPMALTMKNGLTSSDVIAFGQCYLVPPEQSKPEELMMLEAGLFKVKFMGTECPSIVLSP